jgi:hypothetical protein
MIPVHLKLGGGVLMENHEVAAGLPCTPMVVEEDNVVRNKVKVQTWVVDVVGGRHQKKIDRDDGKDTKKVLVMLTMKAKDYREVKETTTAMLQVKTTTAVQYLLLTIGKKGVEDKESRLGVDITTDAAVVEMKLVAVIIVITFHMIVPTDTTEETEENTAVAVTVSKITTDRCTRKEKVIIVDVQGLRLNTSNEDENENGQVEVD